jgi:TP901 family phage tail tape measure protein
MAINLPIVSKYDDKGVKAAEASLAGFGKVAAGIAAAAVAAVGAIAVKSIQEFAKFDEKLNQSIAIMGDVSEAMRGNMSEAAREVARTTTFSADQAAESFFFLASAGLDAEQAVAAMPQVAKFAQAGMFDMALATDLATDAQSALGLSSKDATENLENLTRITDVFVRANTLANTSVEQLAVAFTTKAGTALKTVGKDVEEGAAALALFADQGVKGEIAGTQLTNTIFGLSDQARKAPDAFAKLGISVFDAEGNMRNFADIADDLGGAFEGMSKEQQLAELGALGFSKQARAGVLMLSGQGDKIRDYETALRDAAGFTQDVASKQLLTPTAQFALLGSAIDDIALEIGSVLAPAVGDMAGLFADLVLNTLPAVTEFLETKIVPGLEIFMTAFKDTAVSLREGSTSIETIFKNLFERIVGFFTGEGLTKLLNGFLEMRATIIDAFIKVIPLVVNALMEILPAIVDVLAEMIPPILEQAVDLFLAIVDAIVLVLPNIINALLKMLPKLIESLIGMLPSLVDSAIELFTGIVTALIEVIPNIIETLIEAMPRIVDALIEALPLIIEAAFTLFAGIITALMRQWPEIITALVNLFPKLVGAIIGMVPKMVDAGFQLIKGLAKGLIENIPRLLGEAAAAIGNALTNGVKAVFQIKSPSRVFMDIGENVVTGLEQGITDNLRMLENASIGMASTVTTTAENNMGGMTSPIPMFNPSAGNGDAGATYNITINTGIGTDPVSVGREVVNAIKRFESVSGKVFVGV